MTLPSDHLPNSEPRAGGPDDGVAETAGGGHNLGRSHPAFSPVARSASGRWLSEPVSAQTQAQIEQESTQALARTPSTPPDAPMISGATTIEPGRFRDLDEAAPQYGGSQSNGAAGFGSFNGTDFGGDPYPSTDPNQNADLFQSADAYQRIDAYRSEDRGLAPPRDPQAAHQDFVGQAPAVNQQFADPGSNGAYGNGFDTRFDEGGGMDRVDELFSPEDEDETLSELDQRAAARRNILEWAVVLVAAVLLALVLRAFLVQAFWIPSPSMTTTLLVDDRVLVNKLSYRFNDIERGDIVVFRRTDDEIAATPGLPADVIKRVVGLPGETLEIKENTVYINDQPLDEPYLDPGTYNADFGPVEVPEGHVFVLGDNRAHSQDSRSATGPIDTERIVGRAFVLFWPVDRLGLL